MNITPVIGAGVIFSNFISPANKINSTIVYLYAHYLFLKIILMKKYTKIFLFLTAFILGFPQTLYSQEDLEVFKQWRLLPNSQDILCRYLSNQAIDLLDYNRNLYGMEKMFPNWMR